MHDFRQLAVAANHRYLAFISALDDPTVSVESVARLSNKRIDAGRSYRGFNFFCEQDIELLQTLVRGEHTIRGLRNARAHLHGKSPGQVSRMTSRFS